ncbi:L-type lectin-domain containing receptor kinase VII.1 [Linum grandiflorum]
MNHRRSPFTILLLLLLFFSSHQTSAVDFIFNSFNSGNLLLYGSAAVDAEILTLTNSTAFTIGRALFPQKIRTRNSSHVLPFSTSFIFAMAPYEDALPGHGLVFLFVPFTGISGASSSQNLGFLNRTNDNDPNTHVFGVEFDVFANQEFNDIDDNHVGIDLNSLTSRFANTAGYWPDSGRGGSDFKPLKLNSGQLVQSHKILGWSFSNSNFSISEGLIVTGLPSFVLKSNSIVESKGFVIGIAAGSVFVAICIGILIAVWLIKRSRRMKKKKQDEEDGMEDWELEYWPHRISYQEIESATKGFSEENVIGIGGNGKVYKGVLAAAGGDMIAVKRISPENDGTREFLAEIASLGRLKHRNLVGLRGWCKREKGTFLLVYDYMENGSLDQWIFDSGDGRGEKLLTWHDRIRILTDVAAGIRYLHEGWEVKVLHRDIKASNVLLDKEMNGRLGDFGLARMHEHGQVARTTRVVGTAGYLAPEVIHTGRVSDRTDVFGFGILILEVVSGRRPIVGNVTLVDAMWELMREGKVMECVDRRVRGSNSNRPVDEEEVERVVRLGLVCAHPEPSSRPTMRQVAKVLEVGRIGSETEVAESEDMDAYLLQRAGTDVWMDRYSRSDFGSGWGSHPTMDDVRPTTTSSGSGSWSTTIIEGR